MSSPIQQHREQLKKLHPQLRFYALIDGWQYQQYRGFAPQSQRGLNLALMHDLDGESLANAGPWLFDLEQDQGWFEIFNDLGQQRPAVIWLLSTQPLPELASHLRHRLDTALPEGQRALLRFYDPRVLSRLTQVLAPEQKQQFFSIARSWFWLEDDQLKSQEGEHA